MYCSFHDNTGSGMYPISSAVVIGCLIYDNDDGFTDIADCLLYNCAIDGNADDGVAVLANTNLYPTAYVIGCRITNHVAGGSIGLNANTEIVITGYNYFEDNTGDNIQNATLHQFIPIVGGATTSNIEDQANTTEGYTNTGDTTEDFNLLSDASLRRTAITIPTS